MKITVTGATGNVGEPLVHTLVQGGHSVTAVSRGVSARIASGEGIRPVTADIADAVSLSSALEGSEALYLLVSGAGSHVDGPRLLSIARDVGVRRVVLQSSQAAGTRPGAVSHAPMAALEHTVKGSGLAWAILRPGGFHSNALAWIPSIRREKTVYAPFGDVALPSVDPRDIADVGAAVLTDSAHDGRTYVLTGPEALSPRARTEVIGNTLGYPISFVELTAGQAHEQMSQAMPEPVVEGTLAILGEPTAEELAVSADVETILGRSARPFRDWVASSTGRFR